jgi:hypothetical protein
MLIFQNWRKLALLFQWKYNWGNGDKSYLNVYQTSNSNFRDVEIKPKDELGISENT